MTDKLLSLDAVENDLYSEDTIEGVHRYDVYDAEALGSRTDYRSGADPKVNLEGLEEKTAQVLKALYRGEKPYIPVSRQEIREIVKSQYGHSDMSNEYYGFTDFNDIYVVDGLSKGCEAFTTIHEYLHGWTGKGEAEEKEVLDLTYKVLFNVAENEHVDPESRKLAMRAVYYGVSNAKRFYKAAMEGKGGLAFQQAAGEGEQNREPIDYLVPHLWEVPLRAIDYVVRFPVIYGVNLLSLGSGKSCDVHQEVGISNIGKSITTTYQNWINSIRE